MDELRGALHNLIAAARPYMRDEGQLLALANARRALSSLSPEALEGGSGPDGPAGLASTQLSRQSEPSSAALADIAAERRRQVEAEIERLDRPTPATHTPAPVDQAQDTDDLTAANTLQGAQGGPAASAPAQAQRRALTFLTETPPCRICGKAEGVAQYHPEHPERAICVPCCEAGAEHHDGETGHVFTYVRDEQDRVCDHCGQFAGNTDYYDHWDHP